MKRYEEFNRIFKTNESLDCQAALLLANKVRFDQEYIEESGDFKFYTKIKKWLNEDV